MSDPGPPSARRPAITAPLSRHLSVADIDRSIAFYRDVLGFDVRSLPGGDGVRAVAEAVQGPARIQLGTQDRAFDSTGKLRPRGSAILFFEVDDVAAMRDASRARGRKPSELEKVNWIKMRMFEIRDPDGHALWFGESFQDRRPHLIHSGSSGRPCPSCHWTTCPRGWRITATCWASGSTMRSTTSG